MVEYCKCEGFTQCSVQWDPYDGKSITQAQSDQYKVGQERRADPPQYCESVPPVKKCSSSLEIAYTSHQVFKGEKKIQSR